MQDVYQAVLTCQRCASDTPHEIRYGGRLLIATRCAVCGYAMNAADLHRYLHDLGHRIATKPRRMLRRLRTDPGGFIRNLPITAAAKPFRIAEELAIVVQAARAGHPVPTETSCAGTSAATDEKRVDRRR